MKYLIALLLMNFAVGAEGKTWNVGPQWDHKVPSAVASLVGSGDTVWIEAGLYPGDGCKWSADKLYIAGKGGRAVLDAQRTGFGGKAIWVIAGSETQIENVDFLHCEVVDRNGAGIRLEGTHLTVRYCSFIENQNGILAGDNPLSDILVEHCEFAANGSGNGFTHNIYVNRVRSLTLRYNYIHHAYYGHEVKSRAQQNVILYNRITNEDGDASYEIDFPNGGQALVLGNVIQQSKFSDNNTIIAYGLEGMNNPGPHKLCFLFNTVVSNEDKGVLFNVQSKMDTLLFANNIVAGNLTLVNGIPNAFHQVGNCIRLQSSDIQFADANHYDYHLEAKSPAIDSSVQLDGSFLGYEFVPTREYVHPAGGKERFYDGSPDRGAFERQQLTDVHSPDKEKRLVFAHWDPAVSGIVLAWPASVPPGTPVPLRLIHISGTLVFEGKVRTGEILSTAGWASGHYLLLSGFGYQHLVIGL
ncbi:MAG: right-handed parallel beta-helix repeat-containing protein [Saprospiraceae bacterium]|nr:right-handed parallel beta-helix repeat-containing protein [Saprospiraceae bacterium]